jgi:hypothetical protein
MHFLTKFASNLIWFQHYRPMHDINFVEESFDLKLASGYHLSIQLGLDGFSFCVLDILRDRYINFRHIPLIVGKPQFLARKLEAIFDQEEDLSASYRSVSVCYSTNKATLIPKAYYKPDDLLQLASFTNEISRNEEVRSDNIPGFNYQLVYSYPKDVFNVLNRKYTDFKFMHKSVPFMATALEQRNDKKNSLLINFEKNYIRMIVIKGMEISLFNSFYFKSELDFLYYTLNICQSLQIDPELDEIMISGNVADDSGYIRQLKKYHHNIVFLKPSTRFSYGKIFERTQKHQFISLLNLYLCE